MLVKIPAMLVDLVRVKGKQEPIRIYAPLAGAAPPIAVAEKCRREEVLARQAFALYQARKWREAARVYNELPYPYFAGVLSRRCLALAAAPPPGDWDGAFNLQTK
jgi:hypothetical protein